MAVIHYDELVALLQSEPEYRKKWELGVSAYQGLYIQFSKDDEERVNTEVLELADGGDIALDYNTDGKIVGLEFV